ncbi:voltage-gated potassium channel [Saccharata proteae CBS 121410]|uniref:Voltage-gated potassium channel n=1 Tax=Saccharata proteae CBS 121410 TaxID=1314787 RepID=A0A6A5YFC6_9PEZI|nr:voltage-gated potassium channel [Saccharata proteae CBS 121410]
MRGPAEKDGGIKIADQAHKKSERYTRWRSRRKRAGEQASTWWFASTAIPLLAATIGPLANVLSIAALVTTWREWVIVDGESVSELEGVGTDDPRWCYWLNVASLICGFLGNFFLLMNFTQRIRYIVALPMTIVFWYIATGLLAGITACMNIYVPPARPEQTYTQGYWYAVIAAVLYCICSMILMINMLGYWLGHYPQTFTLTDSQRQLILQTMCFFIWLAGGGTIFARIESLYGEQDWSFVDGLYFCDVTILTVGFGDLYPTCDVGRGLVFPYSVGGIIMLGLVISSIHNSASDLGQDKIINKHINKMRSRTFDRTVSSTQELHRRQIELHPRHGSRPPISGPFNPVDLTAATRIQPHDRKSTPGNPQLRKKTSLNPVTRLPALRPPRILLLREEKDRFDAMRNIQHDTARFKRWYALTLSVLSFSILWCIGAVVFWHTEKDTQNLSYFQALYFCYVSLLTIGYGDESPKSNAGRCFFVVWSLVAVPTMTILISDMGDTVIDGFKRGTVRLAEFTVLPKEGIWRSFLERNEWLERWLEGRKELRARKKRIRQGIPIGPPADDEEGRNEDAAPSNARLARRLAAAIKRTAKDLQAERPKRYNYEEWVEFTRLIRFTAKRRDDVDEETEGLVEWDWIGEDSPMMATESESEFVLDRLLESLTRYVKRTGRERDIDAKRDGR